MKKPLIAVCALAVLALASPAAAAPRDRDRDGLPDSWERRHHLSTKHGGANADPDHDRIDNRNELRQGTDPRARDTDRDRLRDGREDGDGDGLSNAAEDTYGQDPADPDTDNDGLLDGQEHAGVVESFAGGRLVIALASGGTVEARVGEDTDIGCGSEAEAEQIQDREPGAEPEDPTAEELESEEVSDEEAAADDGDDGDLGVYDAADASDDDAGDDDSDADFGDVDDPEFQDDEHDFEDVCPTRSLRPGVRVHEAALDGAAFDEVEVIRTGG
jgi:hypothetical protein